MHVEVDDFGAGVASGDEELEGDLVGPDRVYGCGVFFHFFADGGDVAGLGGS